MTKNERIRYEHTKPADAGKIARQIAEQQIAPSAPRVCLVYTSDVATGWCNTNDKTNFPLDSCGGTHFHSPAFNREMAVVCFEIAPALRG